jgi:tetratricopeptide (TPR) repeat protein
MPMPHQQPPPLRHNHCTIAILDSSAPVILDSSAPAILDSSAPVILDSSAPVILDSSAPVILDSSAPVILSRAKDLNRINFFNWRQFLFLIFLFSFYTPTAHAQMENLKDMYERAINAYNQQQYDQAIDLYQQIIKVVPTFAPAYNGLALANQASSGDEDKTIEYLKTAISYDPHMTQAYDNLGRIYYDRQDVDQAQEYFEKALKIDPNLASAQLSLAWINLLARSKPKTALTYFKKVLAVSQDPKIYFGMGSAYFASNQRPEAMEMITKLHELGQDDLAARLEKSMRDNTEVNTEGDSNGANSSSQPAGLGPLATTPDKPTGMQVRLRGKLSDY